MKFSTETTSKIEQLIEAEIIEKLNNQEIEGIEIEATIRGLLKRVGQDSYGKILERIDEKTQGKRETCECGGVGKRVSKRKAKVISIFGRVEYQRSYYKCEKCGKYWSALDKKQQLRPGRATPMMSSMLGLAGITVAFEEGRRHIKQYLGVEISANTIRQETYEIGKQKAKTEKERIERSQDTQYLQERERRPQKKKRIYGSIDGAYAPLIGEWHEVKTLCWYEAGQKDDKGAYRTKNKHYHSSLEKVEAFSEFVWGTAVHHRVDQAEELVFVNDGAQWIWKLVQANFPQAIQIVDWYHANQYLHAVAEDLVLPDEDKLLWFEEMQSLLWDGNVEEVIHECRLCQTNSPDSKKSLISYYTNNMHRMRYADFRDKGYLIGSGTVESACKQIVAMRLKRSGARWKLEGASLMAKARAAWLSNDWCDFAQLSLAG